MQAYVNIRANVKFKLSQAVLVYRGGGDGAFASLHQVKQAENGIPHLTPGEALTTAFLRTLAQGLGAQVKPEILPDTVLARTPDMLVWWSLPRLRVMFFGGANEEGRKLNGLLCQHQLKREPISSAFREPGCRGLIGGDAVQNSI